MNQLKSTSIKLNHNRCTQIKAQAQQQQQQQSQSTAVKKQDKKKDKVKKNSNIFPVEQVRGIRLQKTEDEQKRFEYLIKWKDDETQSWESPQNLSEDVVRDIEEKWWRAVRTGEEETVKQMLIGAGPVLARIINMERRSALHFAAALNRAGLVELLLQFGANPNLQDNMGYTPLHMAAGYMHVRTVKILLDFNADPMLEDNTGRSTMSLIESLQDATAQQKQNLTQAMALNEVKQGLLEFVYEDVIILKVVDQRKNEEGDQECLVKYQDNEELQWVPKEYLSQEVLENFEKSLELAEAEKIVDSKEHKDLQREYLVQWKDGQPDTWLHEDSVSTVLILEYENEQKAQKIKAEQDAQEYQKRLEAEESDDEDDDDDEYEESDDQKSQGSQQESGEEEDVMQQACKELQETHDIEKSTQMQQQQQQSKQYQTTQR